MAKNIIVCIESNKLPITVGKEYEILARSESGSYYIIDDDLENFWYSPKYFEDRIKYRNRIINDILNV